MAAEAVALMLAIEDRRLVVRDNLTKNEGDERHPPIVHVHPIRDRHGGFAQRRVTDGGAPDGKISQHQTG